MVGLGAVYYDNVIVVTHSENAARAMKRTLDANARVDRLSVTIKALL